MTGTSPGHDGKAGNRDIVMAALVAAINALLVKPKRARRP
jgi:hypothetical protein